MSAAVSAASVGAEGPVDPRPPPPPPVVETEEGAWGAAASSSVAPALAEGGCGRLGLQLRGVRRRYASGLTPGFRMWPSYLCHGPKPTQQRGVATASLYSVGTKPSSAATWLALSASMAPSRSAACGGGATYPTTCCGDGGGSAVLLLRDWRERGLPPPAPPNVEAAAAVWGGARAQPPDAGVGASRGPTTHRPPRRAGRHHLSLLGPPEPPRQVPRDVAFLGQVCSSTTASGRRGRWTYRRRCHRGCADPSVQPRTQGAAASAAPSLHPSPPGILEGGSLAVLTMLPSIRMS
eukprot:COSAG01_NODE_3081_length_6620_cov_26.409230_5_plen_293_part_00